MTGSSAVSRLSKLASHFVNPTHADVATGDSHEYKHRHNYHTLSPTFFLPRAAAIEPEAEAIYHITANGQVLQRSYAEFSDRARGFAYYLKKHNLKQVGILATNTPAFLEAIFGIAAAGAVSVAINYRLKPDDITYIFDHAQVDSIVVDAEYEGLLEEFRRQHPLVKIIVDTDTDAVEGEAAGPFDHAVLEGLKYDQEKGGQGWDGLQAHAPDEESTFSLAYTSGTTARPKGVEYTHRGAYLAALGNVIESGLNYQQGWTFPWSITAVRGTHYCLRKIDYPLIWKLLTTRPITHFNAAPTVNTLLCADPNATKLENPVRVTVAASPPTAHLFETMTKLNLHPVHVYGLTETYGPITKGYHMPAWETLETKDKYARMARQGHGFITSLPVRVIKHDPDNPPSPGDPLVDVERNGKEIGEIVFQGNICAKGYYRDAEATKKLWQGGVNHSGDLAVWHPDGAIQILDRAKDIIISGGENISSVALESMLVQHPGVLECGVVGVQDERWGERPVAFVTVREGMGVEGGDVITWAKEQSNISRFMVPREVVVVEELPKTSTGKVKKNVLREWARGNRDAA